MTIIIYFLESTEECFQISTHVDVKKQNSPSRMPWMLAPKPSPVKVTTHHKSEILHQWKVQDATSKRKLQTWSIFAKEQTHLLCLFPPLMLKKVHQVWIGSLSPILWDKNEISFWLSRFARLSSQPGLTETMSSNKQIARHLGWQWTNLHIRIDFRHRASNGTDVTSKQIWIAREILQYPHQMNDWINFWSVLG